MNFAYLPELQWKFGYFGVLGIMAVVSGLQIWWFKRKNWL
jgi:magnesium transporter